MANWCRNIVTFECCSGTMEKLRLLFERMVKQFDQTDNGQLPDFVTNTSGYFFNIYWENEVVYYETKWVPNLSVLREIATHFNTGFTCNYDELNNLIYGEAVFENSKMRIIELDAEDFDKYQYIEQTDRYSFEGKEYGCEYEISEILLERKISIRNLRTDNL